MVSAVKIGGRRLHELARAGEEVERAPRPVHVDRFDVVGFEPGPYPEADVEVECGSGTYVRSLAADLGVALGGFAHLGALRRTRVGSFTLAESRPLVDIEADPPAAVLPLTEAMRDLERVDVDAEQARAISHGVSFAASAAHRPRGGSVRARRSRRRPAGGLRHPRRGPAARGRPGGGVVMKPDLKDA